MVNWTSRGINQIYHAAEERVRQRLNVRDPIPASQILADSGLDSSLIREGTTLINNLAKLLGVDAARLRADDRLEDLVRVNAQELTSVSPDSWRRAGLRGFIVVHVYDIMHMVETFSDYHKWKEKWASLLNPPRNEEQWIDLILDMTVSEFVNFFAPLAKR